MLCDTNGGTLPHEVEQIVAEMVAAFDPQIGVHFHNDAGCAVANSLAGVRAGATQVQGCVNGYGRGRETPISPPPSRTSRSKLRIRTIPEDRLERLTPVAHHIAELVNLSPNPQQPYVGTAGSPTRQGCTRAPSPVGATLQAHPARHGRNGTRSVVSELAGRSTLALKAEELGFSLALDALDEVLTTLSRPRAPGIPFRGGRRLLGALAAERQGGRRASSTSKRSVSSRPQRHRDDEATVKVRVSGERVVATAEGNGPVNALDSALRQAMAVTTLRSPISISSITG